MRSTICPRILGGVCLQISCPLPAVVVLVSKKKVVSLSVRIARTLTEMSIRMPTPPVMPMRFASTWRIMLGPVWWQKRFVPLTRVDLGEAIPISLTLAVAWWWSRVARRCTVFRRRGYIPMKWIRIRILPMVGMMPWSVKRRLHSFGVFR